MEAVATEEIPILLSGVHMCSDSRSWTPHQRARMTCCQRQPGKEREHLSTCSIRRYSSFLHLEGMDHPVDTPAYGRRLLPATIDQIATNQPDRAWASLPRTDADLSQGYIEITYRAFAKAINEVSWLIEKHFGRSENFETIAYLGMPDIRYYMLQMAAAKTGYQVCGLISFSYKTDAV